MSYLVAIPYADVGKAAKTLFDPKAFASDAKVSFTGVTSSGIAFTASAKQSGNVVQPAITCAYITPKYAFDATYDNTDKVALTTTFKQLAPNLKVTGSVVLPAYEQSAKLAVEYALPAVHLKSIIALTASPTVEIAAASGYGNVIIGAEAGYDTAKSIVSKYTLAAGYHAVDYQISATLADQGQTLKLAYAHNMSKLQTVGAEVVRKGTGDTTFALGYHRKLDSGASTKFRLDNTGALNIGYETKLASGEKVVSSVQVNTTELSKPPKYGFALDLF